MGIRAEDLIIEVYRPNPPGGQHVGTYTGIKITHKPTGLIAICESERSQYKNKAIAIDMIAGGLTNFYLNYTES